mmetsp:Transcript_24576/g.97016  ORF Transcript_24576/g.97016 Transcript_24576/m.97016 type:complete len:240 (+) Transcript_24576:2092-2811(+)
MPFHCAVRSADNVYLTSERCETAAEFPLWRAHQPYPLQLSIPRNLRNKNVLDPKCSSFVNRFTQSIFLSQCSRRAANIHKIIIPEGEGSGVVIRPTGSVLHIVKKRILFILRINPAWKPYTSKHKNPPDSHRSRDHHRVKPHANKKKEETLRNKAPAEMISSKPVVEPMQTSSSTPRSPTCPGSKLRNQIPSFPVFRSQRGSNEEQKQHRSKDRKILKEPKTICRNLPRLGALHVKSPR